MRAKRFTVILVAMLGAIAQVSTALAADKAPQTSPEGLELIKETKSRLVYARTGATLDQYTKIALLDCYVAFRKNWERDFNRSAVGLGERVSTDDMERIKKALAEEFRKVFTEELQEKGGYEMVDKAGEEVLILRPAIVNLDVTAPDLNSASMTRTAVASAGQMTLYLELFDSATGDIIARIIDAEAADKNGFAMAANSVTNKAEADRIIRKWAQELGGHLGDVNKALTTEAAN